MLSFTRRKFHNLLSDKKFSEILTGSAWALGARVIATGLAMVTSIIIARVYGAEMLGIVAILNSFLVLATIFTVLGTGTSVLRLIPEHLAKYSPTSAFKVYRKTQFLVAGVSLFTGTLLFLGSGVIAEGVFSKPQLHFYFSLASIFVLFKSLMLLNTSAVRGLRLIRMFAFMQILPQLSMLLTLLALTLFFYHQGNPVYAMFASLAVAGLVGAFTMDWAFKKKTRQEDATQPMPIRDILTLSLPMLMTATMTFIIAQAGVVMLGIFRSEAEVGYYAIAVKLATLTSFVLTSINTMAAPKFSELFHSGNMEELFYVAQKSAKLIFWTTTPILAGLLLLGKPILSLLFGPDFTVAYGALVLLVAGQFVNSISGSTGYFMNMTGNQKVFRNIIIGSAILTVGLGIALIPPFGIIGAATAAMVSLIFWNVSTLVYIKIKYGRMIGYLPYLLTEPEPRGAA